MDIRFARAKVGEDLWKFYLQDVHQITVPEADIQSPYSEPFEVFKAEDPMYWMGKDLTGTLNSYAKGEISIDDLSQVYDKLITAVQMDLYEDCDQANAYADRCLKWLHSTDFYTAPASTIYHESIPHGLLLHTLKVVNKTVELLKLPTFSACKLSEAVLTALTHDWCKIGLYECYLKNVKNESTGTWEKVPSYRRTQHPVAALGHGVSSMFLTQKFFKVNMHAAAAIRWHMGRWYVTDAEVNDLQQCNEQIPLVHLLQFADQLSITSY